MTRNLGRKVLSAGFILNGLVLMGLALTMEWMFGEGLGSTWLEQRVYRCAHVSLHLFGALCSFSIAMFLVDKSKAWTALAAVAVILVGTYGIINTIGFASKNRGGVPMGAEGNSKRVMAKYHDDRVYSQGHVNWLDGQALDYDNAPKVRKDDKAEAAKAKATLDALEPPNVTTQTIDPDSSAILLSRVTTLTLSEASQVLAIALGGLLYISEVLSFIFGVRIWPRQPDEVVGQDAMTDESMIAGLPTPKDRHLTVPADLPTGLAAAGMVPAAEAMIAGAAHAERSPTGCARRSAHGAGGRGHGARRGPARGKGLACGEAPKLRNADAPEHIGVVLAALRSLGLTHKVPSQAIRYLYPSLMVQTGIQPMATNTFCRHLAEVCERSRPRVGKIEGAASKTRAKVVVYTLPSGGTVEVDKKPPPAGAVKTARAHCQPLSRAPSWVNLRGHHALPTEGYAQALSQDTLATGCDRGGRALHVRGGRQCSLNRRLIT